MKITLENSSRIITVLASSWTSETCKPSCLRSWFHRWANCNQTSLPGSQTIANTNFCLLSQPHGSCLLHTTWQCLCAFPLSTGPLNLHSLPFQLALQATIWILSLCSRVPSDTCFYPHAQNNRLSPNPQGLLLQTLSNLLRMPWRPVNALFYKQGGLLVIHFLLLVSPFTDSAQCWAVREESGLQDGFWQKCPHLEASAYSLLETRAAYCTWGQHSVRPEQQATEEEQRTVLYLRSIPLISEHFHKPFQRLSFLLETGCTQLVFTVHLRAPTFTTTIIRCANIFFWKK